MAEVEAQSTPQGAGHVANNGEKNAEASSEERSDLRIVEGVPICRSYDESLFRGAMRYQPKADEVFVVAYPKCGTTWTQFVARRVLHHRHESPMESAVQCMLASFIGYRGSDTPGAVIKTHMPFNKAPFSEEARYIYVLRNPYDCCVSYYNQRLGQPNSSFISFDDFFEDFIQGQVPLGDYFDFLATWFPQTKRPNVLLISYEQLKEDVRLGILRIADFLGEECGKSLHDEPKALETIIKEVSPDDMRKTHTEARQAVLSNTSDKKVMDLAEALRKRGCGKPSPQWASQGNNALFKLIRKATVGDWRTQFSSSQEERLRSHMMAKIAAKIPEHREALLSLWKDVCPL